MVPMPAAIPSDYPPIVVINLASDKDRLAHMEQQLSRFGFTFERFEAIRGLALPEELRARFLDSEGRPLSTLRAGEIGLYASHLAIMQALVRTNGDCMLVMEDDLYITERLPEFLARIRELPSDWDIVRLSNPSKSAYLTVSDLGDSGELVSYLRVPNNTGCYLISQRGASKILSGKQFIKYPIDEDLRRPWDFNLNTFGVVPPPVDANVLPGSSIDAIGARSLANETVVQKLLRRRWVGPKVFARRIAWQVCTFGPTWWVRCLLRAASYRLARSVGLQSFVPLRVRRTPIQ
jgi:glycosyl transferase family 25